MHRLLASARPHVPPTGLPSLNTSMLNLGPFKRHRTSPAALPLLPAAADGPVAPSPKRRKPRADALSVDEKRALFLALPGVISATPTSYECHCGKTIQLVKKNNGRDVQFDQKTYRAHLNYCKGPGGAVAAAPPAMAAPPSAVSVAPRKNISAEEKEGAFLALPGVLAATPVSFECHCGKEIKLIRRKNGKDVAFDRSNYWIHMKYCRGPEGGGHISRKMMPLTPGGSGGELLFSSAGSWRRDSFKNDTDYPDSPLISSPDHSARRWQDISYDSDFDGTDSSSCFSGSEDDMRLFIVRVVTPANLSRPLADVDNGPEAEAQRSELEDAGLREERRRRE
ncbi:hypothetical protein HK101_003968, partial [Irineochytrium annulatum]